jgi:hypothetical protein
MSITEESSDRNTRHPSAPIDPAFVKSLGVNVALLPIQPPRIDSAALQQASTIIGDAAKDFFRKWLVYDHRATYEGCCKSHIHEVTHTVAAAIRVAWKVAEEEADAIAAEALRQAYATVPQP